PHGPTTTTIPLKTPSTNGQLHYLEFQANGAESWVSPEKSLAGASYGVTVQKPSSYPEGGKAPGGHHTVGVLPCQYPFQLLHESGKEPYRGGEVGSQDYVDVGLTTSQLAHPTFTFHSSSREWQEEVLSGGSYENLSPEGRLYGLSVPPPPFLHPSAQPTPHHNPLPCCKGRNEHPTDPNGALPSSGAIDPNPSTFQENQGVFPSSLHSPNVPKPVGTRSNLAKEGVPTPRLLLQSSPLRRNVPPNSLPQVHFQSKPYCRGGGGGGRSVPFQPNLPPTALVQAWEGATKAFSPMDQNSAPYSNPVGNQFSYECQPGPEQRQHRQKNGRMPWQQQVHLTSAMPAPNRLELSRQVTSQKLPFPLVTSEWQGSRKAAKGSPLSNSPGFHSKKLVAGESLGVQRGDPNSAGAFAFENGKEPRSPTCDSRSKALFYSMSQAGPPPPPSRSSSGSALVLPPSALVAASPCQSPLPSPVPNPTCSSTCSSLSPMSSSPLNAGFEDGQISGALTPSPFFQHPCHPKDGNKTFHPSDVLSSNSLHYHSLDSIKSFHFPPDALKDDNLLKCPPASPLHKAGLEVTKGCSDGLDGEQPPPPYSSHHLLASSLSSASLDQLDVLLTCKQCDQNYSNLSSFLQHRQFCTSHPTPHGEGKDAPRAAEGRKVLPTTDPPKPQNLALSPDPHLLALNKGDDFLLDGESKSEGKEDALKGNLFNGLASSSLPLTASDLDIDDAKLDSLITEALNGLGYQSDNPEIDSSFIDVFADEELPGVKAAGGGMSHKTKEALSSDSKSKQAAAKEKVTGQPKSGFFHEDNHPGGEQVKRGGKQHLHKGRVAQRLAAQELDPGAAGVERTGRLRAGRKNSIPPITTTSSKYTSSQKHLRKLSQEPPTKSEVVATKSSKPPRFSMKEMKRRKPRSGTWSKELIHKIVQQKNKLHKLQVKSSKQQAEKRPGRREKTKEKDPAWSYSLKRDKQKREEQEHGKVPSQEVGEKKDCATRARRRSSQSSTCSNHSENMPSEVGTSPAQLDGAGSSSEKKGGRKGRRRCLGSPRTPLPEERSSKKSQEDFPRGSRPFGSAKPLVAAPRTQPRCEGGVDVTDSAKEETFPQPHERQQPGMDTSSRSPISLSSKEGSEEPKVTAKPMDEVGEPTLEAQDSPELSVFNQRHQFAPFTNDGLKFHHHEEMIATPQGCDQASPGSASAAYSEAGIKYLKAHGLSDGQKDYPTPVAPYEGDAVGMMLNAKDPDPYVSSDNAFFSPKGLSGHYDDNLFSKPPTLGSSHMDEMYLCRDDISTTSFEQKHASISPYTTETPQGKVSSPLSFDSSSIFGELPVSEFDPPLYESVSASKDGYVTTFTCPGNPPSKPLPFEQPYPPFMPEKDWSLMEEVLPEDMTQFHSLSVEKPLAKKFPEEGPVPPNQLSLPLTDRMVADYNVTFMNNMSDDDLEIKRLVTELESQLQTSKLDNEASVTLQKPEEHATSHLGGEEAKQFPPLAEEQEAGQEKGLFLGDELDASRLCVRERQGGDKPAMASVPGDYERSREPWSCSVELGSLETGMCTPAPLNTNPFCSKERGEEHQGAVATKESESGEVEKESSSKSLPGSGTPDHTEEPIYTDPMTKSPPVVPSSMFSKTLEAAEATKDPLPCQQGAESFPVLGKADESLGGPAELEKFDAHLPKPAFGFQQAPSPPLDLAFSSPIREVPDPEERPSSRSQSPKILKEDDGDSMLVEEKEERKSPTTFPAPGPSDKANKQKVLLFDMLSLPKESECSSQEMLASQETSANPLQQLQLFVARTVKSNEEELLMPCFPMLLAPNHPSTIQPEQKEEGGGALEEEHQPYCPAQGEGDIPLGDKVENIAVPVRQSGLLPSGCEELESFSTMGSYQAKPSTSAKLEVQKNIREMQHLAPEPMEQGDINIPADGVSQEHGDLPTHQNTVVTPPPGKKADQVGEEENRETLAFEAQEESHLQKETLSRAAAERMERNTMGQEVQPLKNAPMSPTSPPGASQEEFQQDHHLVVEAKASTVGGKAPREGNGKKKSSSGCDSMGESPASLSSLSNLSHLQGVESHGAKEEEVPVFNTQLSDEKKSMMRCPQGNSHHDSSLPCSSPFNPKNAGKEVPKSTSAVLASSSVEENPVCTITGLVVDSAPPETPNYPVQLTTDPLLIIREDNLDEKKKLESCSDDEKKHQSEAESLANGSIAQQVSAGAGDLMGIEDLGPAGLNGQEVGLGELSKATESGGKSSEGEKPKIHATGGETGTCVLNHVGQGEGNMQNGPPKPSPDEGEGSFSHKEKKANGLPVTCDICSATFRSKPGLTRHKAVKHQVRNGGTPQPSKNPRSTLIPADRISKGTQKMSRRSLKALFKDKICSSEMATTDVDHVPKEINPEVEKEPSTQMQEVVSRVLSDLSVISFEMSQELHRTRVLQREMKAKGLHLETRGAEEAKAEVVDPGEQVRRGEKGRRNQSKDPGDANSSCEKKLNRKVRRRKAKVFPSRNEPGGSCELEEVTGLPSAVLSSNPPMVMEGSHELRSCISPEEHQRYNSSQHPQKAQQAPCAAEILEDPGDRMVVALKETVSTGSVMAMVACPEKVEETSGVEDTPACQKWVGGFVEQVEKGLSKVSKEQHHGGDDMEEVDAETGDSGGKQSGVPPSPTEEVLPLHHSEATQKALQTSPGVSPPPAEPEHWVKVDMAVGREQCAETTGVPDLQSLFDDDSTFSQLFPRDDQFARRKCTRVYGKRSKKPKAVTKVNLQPEGTMDLFTIQLAPDLNPTTSFCVTREDPCEYETISVDDALMLNMCHGSKKGGEAAPRASESIEPRLDQQKNDQGKEDIDLEDNMLTFLCQSSQGDGVPSLNIWGSLEKEGESLSAEDMFEPLMDLEDEESIRGASSEPPDLAEEPYDGKADEDPDSGEFHTLDLEMLNAKLKMRDMCFFSPCEDLPGHGEDNSVSFKAKPGQQNKQRSKMEEGKVGKTRSEMTIKAKDKQYKCKVCFQWFLTLGELDFHKLSHNPSPPPTCYMCVQRKFSSREQLRDHLKEKHAKNKAGLWACGMCLKEISDVWMYNEHLREHATQFARKGQAQKSVMGLPACFGEDNAAVTQFLNTIMCRKPSRSSRHVDPSSKHLGGRETKSPKEFPVEVETKVGKDPSESSLKVKAAPSSSKASSSPSPEHGARGEGTPKSVPMHPDCKDPSRDCHHCGKQFPKPFKLQRHLVVHSLQKIYLCHKCPMFYQETKELRNHLGQEHGVVEEQEIKHTTLYACELCADVMHVIKKSFICSMCNYTFSKKEQYDRHMEKHLAGSSKTFKFRGVMRPGGASREKVKDDSSPPSKKRKVAHHGSSVHLDLQLVEPTNSLPTATGAPQPSVKTEELVGDFSDLLAEMEKSQFDPLAPPPCLSPRVVVGSSPELGHISALSMEELEKGAFDGKQLPFLDSPEEENMVDTLENPGGAPDAMDGIPFLQLAKKVSELPLAPQAETPVAKETPKWCNPSNSSSWEGASKDTSPEAAHHPVPLKDKTVSPTLNRVAKDSALQKKTTGGSEAAPGVDSPKESQQPMVGKEKPSPEVKESSPSTKDQGGNPSKSTGHQPRGEAAGNTTRNNQVELSKATSKLHPKRRKEHKSLSHRGSSGSRENMEGDGKKKKTRTPCPGRSESTGELKRAGWSNAEASALSPGRKETQCNKLVPKPKTGPQVKKMMVLDTYNQKKGELRHPNGEMKRRKAILGKSLHQVLAKGQATSSPRGTLHGPRGGRGGKASVTTNQSQNNLLSQLFGQKLTSFKIPLRRETSE
ncbi:ZN469 protein, partial [Turnix velox]|nr:ZN469 protein [Turnix velox]